VPAHSPRAAPAVVSWNFLAANYVEYGVPRRWAGG
jgi:hypothetical protein